MTKHPKSIATLAVLFAVLGAGRAAAESADVAPGASDLVARHASFRKSTVFGLDEGTAGIRFEAVREKLRPGKAPGERGLSRRLYELDATAWRDLTSAMSLEVRANVKRERNSAVNPPVLGRGSTALVQDYSAALHFADGWAMTGDVFDREGWDLADLEGSVRRMNNGEEPSERGLGLALSWEAQDYGVATPLRLALRVERRFSDAAGPERFADGPAHALRFDLDARF